VACGRVDTNFSYSNLKIAGMDVSVTVKNTGGAHGAEVAQLYLGFPAAAARRAADPLSAERQRGGARSTTTAHTVADRSGIVAVAGWGQSPPASSPL
jgi:hypothetical protein